ncbi:Ig-like domain-containing protein [Actinoplanes ianthinogenes]|uniref:Ig-like domain-containing protein n=1 Tax=Actinoplanes ianthinogenes TaxID=122358 RepID=UPI001670E2F3|nr:Ig-like domain-containing protein [Actinoplanes ianthinogenes]
MESVDLNRVFSTGLARVAAAVVAGAATAAVPLAPALAAELPDLRVTVGISPAKATYAVGDQVTFTFTVANVGDAPAVRARLEGGDEDGVTRASDPPGEPFGLAPGATHTITWDGVIDKSAAVGGAAAGAWSFVNDAGEANASDNTARYRLLVPGLTGNLTVKTFADLLGNYDSRQRGTSGVGLTLTGEDGATVATATTDATGIARFTDLPASNRYVLVLTGWQQRGEGGRMQVKGGETMSASIALVPGSGPAEARPTVSGTGLTDGQQLGLYPTIHPAYADDVAVTKVEVLVGDVVAGSFAAPLPADLSFTVPNPAQLHDTDATVTVRAYDADGNSGSASTRVHVDVLAPEATITPAFGTTLSGVTSLQATGLSPDVARIEVRDSRGAVVARADRAPWTLTWDTRGRNGDEAVMVHVFDTAGNARNLGGVYRIDNAGPAVKSVTPGAGALVRGTVRTTVSASDPSGIASATVLGGKPTSSPFTWTVTPVAQGAFTIEWTVTDRLGNRTTVRRVVVNDTVRPTLKVTKRPKNNTKLTKKTTLTAAASDRNGVAKVQLLVNGKVVATDFTAGYHFTLNPKRYGKKFTVQLRAYDKAGNVTYSTKRTYRR